jgi:predicted permease
MKESLIKELWRRLKFLSHAREFESDLDEEMRFHLEMKAEKTGDRHQAQKQFGNIGMLKEVSREMWGWSSIERLFQDLRYALRQLARNPGFTAVAMISLALGIGANTAIFSLIDHVMLRLLPVSHPEELSVIRGGRSYPQFEQIRDRNQIFSATIGTHLTPQMEVHIEGRPASQAMGEMVSGNYFPALGVGAVVGRTILPEDDRAAESGPVAVISYAYWQRIFGGSPDVLGRKMQVRTGQTNGGTSGLDVYDAGRRGSVDGAVLTIIGVAPPEFFGDTVGLSVDAWIPITMQPAVMPGRPFLTQNNASWVNIMGRRRSGVSQEQASAALIVLYRQILADAEGTKLTESRKRQIAETKLLVETGEKGFGPIRREFSEPLLILMAVVGMVLLIACLNVANLLLARATARRREIGVRLSLGAGRVRLIRQLLTESLVLAIAGGAVGVLIAFVGARVLITMLAGVGPELSIPFETDFRTLGFTAAISILTGVLFGLAPALRATRITLAETMKETSRGSAGSRRVVAAKVLVAAQVAVSMLLLVGSGLFLRTLYNLKAEDVGYNPDHLVLMRVDPVSAGYRGEEVGRAMQNLLERVRAVPGVRVATFSENGLFSGTESGEDIEEIEGFTPNSDKDRQTRFDQIGPAYFTNVGIPILLGRDIGERDVTGAPRVAVINDTMAKFYFKGSNPIGKHFTAGDKVRLEVVGVVRDAQDHDFRDEPVRRFYVSYFQPIDGITTANFEVRTIGNPGSVMSMLRSEAQSFNRNLPIIGIKDVRELMDADLVQERLIAKLSGFFAALAILLAAIGLYGVMSYAVSRRTNEIGIRMALGAGASSVVSMILGEVIVLIGAGAVVGIVAAFGLTRLIKSFLFGLTAMDPISFGAAAVLLLAVGALAGYLPARRASKIDPMIALRYE